MSRETTAAKRYEELGLADALSRPYDHPSACHELSLILRLAYAKLPKNLQSLVFADTLSAFRLLPEVQTSSGISAAHVLVQAAEASLPKQKKSLAVSEFKRAAVAHKRRGKVHQFEGSLQLPQDVLVHIFSFLDMRSLVIASSVCWAWNSAAKDNGLWRLQYSLLFGDVDSKTEEQTHKQLLDKRDIALSMLIEGEDAFAKLDWREAFQRKYTGSLSWRTVTHRAICGHCESLIWLSDMPFTRSHHFHKLGNQKFKIKPVSHHKVVDYLLGDTDLAASSDSDDSDSEGSMFFTQGLPKLWAYPRLIDEREQL